MAAKKTSEGVGKKIVEALKKQSEIEITPIPSAKNQVEDSEIFDELSESFEEEYEQNQNLFEENFEQEQEMNATEDFPPASFSGLTNDSLVEEAPIANPSFINYQQRAAKVQDSFMQELDSFEIPSNIAVLKKLITQLPSGVTRHTGAQIIKQTMEALGISMKSVLQEAQQVQEGLNASANECLQNIQEYKKQIMLLEKQSQNYHRQYTALNELISLFIQTGV